MKLRSEKEIMEQALELEAFAAEQRRREGFVWWQSPFQRHVRYIEAELKDLTQQLDHHRRLHGDRKKQRKIITQVIRRIERIVWPEDFSVE